MRILTVVHQADAGPGVFAQAAEASGQELDFWHPAEAEAPLELES